MANKACLARLRKELRAFDPPPYIRAVPLESNIQEWHYVLQGPPDSPYEGGLYHGKLKFPDDFPFRPPSIFMITPNGRFETNRRLCLSISDFHPETWVPTWSVCTILNGVLSFMLETANTTGAVQTDLATKHRLRDGTQDFNAKDPIFCRLFPELVSGKLFTLPPAPPDASPAEATGGGDVAGQPGVAAGGDSGGTGGGVGAPPTDQLAACGLGGECAGAAGFGEAAKGGGAGGDDSARGGEAGSAGRNAARNRKKRDKERLRRLGDAEGGAGESLEEGISVPAQGAEEESGPGGDGGNIGSGAEALAALEA